MWGRQGDYNESPTPQRDPKVMGKVRRTTEVLIRQHNEKNQKQYCRFRFSLDISPLVAYFVLDTPYFEEAVVGYVYSART